LVFSPAVRIALGGQLVDERRIGEAAPQRPCVLCRAKRDVVTVAPEADLVPRLDPERVTQILRDDHLPLGTDTMSHTDEYNWRWLLVTKLGRRVRAQRPQHLLARPVRIPESVPVLVPAYATDELARSTPWQQLGRGLVFVPTPEGKTVKNRSHIDLAPHISDGRDAEIAPLLDRGATRVEVGQEPDVT